MITALLLAALPAPAEPLLIRSQSGQFLVRGAPLGVGIAPSYPTGEVSRLRIDPALLVVGLERIKAALLTELRLADRWKGTVYVTIEGNSGAPVTVRSIRHPNNWSYRVTLPIEVERTDLLRTMVEVLLSEIANRKADARGVELPPWLVPGLAAELQATALADFSIAPASVVVRSQRAFDPLVKARLVLQSNPALSLDDLNLPRTGESAALSDVYEACAQVFVHELLRLPDGPAMVNSMLASLPEFLNWQTAFLLAFEAHFPRLIDVDRWWSLNLVHVTGRGLAAQWSPEESWRRLDECLITPVRVRAEAGDLPVATGATLQQILSEWEPARRDFTVDKALQQLAAVRQRVTDDLVRVVDDYRATLERFRRQRGSDAGPATGKGGRAAARPRAHLQEIVRALDELDLRRARLRAALTPSPAQPAARAPE